jgi:hypothetical protein
MPSKERGKKNRRKKERRKKKKIKVKAKANSYGSPHRPSTANEQNRNINALRTKFQD